MPRPRPEALALAERYRLGVFTRPRGGPAGERLGRGTGSSLEIEDRRAYSPGDDVRHLDWRAYARTDQLFVQVHREEVQPRVEVLLDASASMAVEDEKAQLAVDLAALFVACARAEGSAAVLFVLGDEVQVLPFDALVERGVTFDALTPLGLALRHAKSLLRPQAVRLVVSDFLFPHDASALVGELGARAGALALVQLLGALDANPPADEALRLIDAEGGATADLVLDRATLAAYKKRLERLRTGLEQAATARGATCTPRVAGGDLEAHARELVGPGLLAPAH